MTYHAPVKQLRFALDAIAGLPRLYGNPAFPELSADLVDAVLDEAGRFAAEVLAPLNRVGDQEGAKLENGKVTLPSGFADAYQAFVAAGWNGITGVPEYGGQGLPHAVGIAVQEMWQSANMAFGLCPILSQGAIEALTTHGTPDQKRLYLPKLISGEWTGTMNLTEPHAGSDVGALKTKAVKQADGTYKITGTKIFITWGEHDAAANIVHLVLARLPDAPPGTRGISLFLVPKFLLKDDGTPGAHNDLRCVGLEHKLGIHGSPTCVMSFGDGGGATGFLIGRENKGMAAMFTMMNAARLNVGVQGVAIAERSFQQALAFARERRQGKPFGLQHEVLEMSPIIFHADVRRMLLTQKAIAEAGRAICLANATAIDEARHGETPASRAAAKAREELLTPLSKAWCTDMGVEAASLGVQVHGGMGFIEETGAAQHYRDARIAPIYEGTNGIQAIDLIGRKLALEGGETIRCFLSEIAQTAAIGEGAPSQALQSIGRELARAHRATESATAWLQERMRTSPNEALPGAAPYLKMLGTLAGAHFLARGALAACDRLAAGDADKDFLNARIATAQFFAEQVLPPTEALLGPVTRGAGGPFALSGDEIGA
ncbi:MAG: acyl-CoA dehydrogenase C-terminal domain-containing protein [Alphaproteobacteria bacterium]|nr:acyl-CoA dehydrogenase C-terminal domain-containing protein [Alphaproteobacteria bacterium]